MDHDSRAPTPPAGPAADRDSGRSTPPAGPAADRDLLTIGRFSRLSGLSIGALRHYDELDVLRPARVDPATGYRSYAREQLGRARLIARLRELEVPLDDVRAVLEADDPAERRRLLAVHRARVEARTHRLQRVLHALLHLSAEEGTPMPKPPLPPEIDPATRRALAAGLYNRCWELLEIPDRTPEQDAELIHTAHASRYHWGEIADTPARIWRGEWMCSRVYSVLGRAEPALWHARRAVMLVETTADAEDPAVEAWDRPAVYEGMARASFVAGDAAEGAAWKARAKELAAAIADADDREIIERDLASLPG
jgi:DNA-binding transcriptional MerR regulator